MKDISAGWFKFIVFIIMLGAAMLLMPMVPTYLILMIIFAPLGIALGASTVLGEYLLVWLIFLVLCSILPRYRRLVAAVLTVCFMYLMPNIFNAPTYDFIQELSKDDMEMDTVIGVTDTVLLDYQKKYLNDEHRCNELCEKLLYNGLAKNIIIKDGRTNDLNAFHIRSDNACEPANWMSATLQARMKARECLEKIYKDELSADVVYVYEQVAERDEDTDLNPFAKHVDAYRISVFVNGVRARKLVYRKTLISARLIKQPLMITPFGDGIDGRTHFSRDVMQHKHIDKQFLNWGEDDRSWDIWGEHAMRDFDKYK
jgi:hypothetical protein